MSARVVLSAPFPPPNLRAGKRLHNLRMRTIRQVTIPLRRAYYVEQPAWTRALRALPASARRSIGIDDKASIGSRRIELGAGPHPHPGYIHLDVDRTSRHLEGVTPAWNLPFPDSWAEEILAIHMFEHIPPSWIDPTLAEWQRVLTPGGKLQLHVPDAASLLERFLSVPPPEKWKFVNAILGMYGGPDIEGPSDIHTHADHQLLLDWPLLKSILQLAGFVGIKNVSATVRDRHTEAWSGAVEQFSLIVVARKA